MVDDSKADIKVVGTTVQGKELAVYADAQSYTRIMFTKGGQLPANLQGRYLRVREAVNDINQYLFLNKQEAERPKRTRAPNKKKATFTDKE